MTPEKSRRVLNLQQRSALAGEAAAAVAEVETALDDAGRPVGRRVLRRRQHDDAGREHLPSRARAAPAQVLHDPRDPRGGLEAGLLPDRRRRGPRPRRADPGVRALLHRRPHRRRARVPRRGDLRRGHGPPDLAGHARAGADAPRRGRAGLAGHGGPDRDRADHRPPARAHRGAGHGGRARGRRLHRPARRRHAARAREGGGDQGAGRPRGARPQPLLGVLRLLQRPHHAVAGRPSVRGQPRRAAAGPRQARGLADPRLPHRPQGRPGRRLHGAPWPAQPPEPSPRAWPYAVVATVVCPGPFRRGWAPLTMAGRHHRCSGGIRHDVG